MKRFQARRGCGRFTRNTTENTLGLHVQVCATCRGCLPHPVGTAAPDVCHHCGAIQVYERCAHGRCTERFPTRRDYPECGKPAIACDIQSRWGLCGEHIV